MGLVLKLLILTQENVLYVFSNHQVVVWPTIYLKLDLLMRGSLNILFLTLFENKQNYGIKTLWQKLSK